MAESVDIPVGGPGTSPGELPQPIEQIQAEAAPLEIAPTELDGLVEDALSTILEPQGTKPNPSEEFRKALGTGNPQDEINQEIATVISDVERPGAPDKDNSADDLTKNDALVDRTAALYSEMTVLNVAWGIAQRTQKDVSHLLKGQ